MTKKRTPTDYPLLHIDRTRKPPCVLPAGMHTTFMRNISLPDAKYRTYEERDGTIHDGNVYMKEAKAAARKPPKERAPQNGDIRGGIELTTYQSSQYQYHFGLYLNMEDARAACPNLGDKYKSCEQAKKVTLVYYRGKWRKIEMHTVVKATHVI